MTRYRIVINYFIQIHEIIRCFNYRYLLYKILCRWMKVYQMKYLRAWYTNVTSTAGRRPSLACVVILPIHTKPHLQRFFRFLSQYAVIGPFWTIPLQHRRQLALVSTHLQVGDVIRHLLFVSLACKRSTSYMYSTTLLKSYYY